MSVVRMNSAHLEPEGFRKIVENVREADPSIVLLIDTKGPEIRTTHTADNNPVAFRKDDELEVICDAEGTTSPQTICVNCSNLHRYVKPGDRLLIDDGELSFLILDVLEDRFTVRCENDGMLGSRKSVNLPGVSVPLPSVSERDKRNLGYAAELGVDFVAHSFVRSADDVHSVQRIISDLGADIKVISKIENQEGVDNFDSILEASYGIMIARGDLGIEVPAERIPGIQMEMIKKCIAAHKPVIVATQMLHTMIHNPRPTRAEISDVANAVYQRADALMLSGETANGKYPVEAVETMCRVAREVEQSMTMKLEVPPLSDHGVTSFLARQAALSEKEVGTEAIVTDAFHGMTARYIASFRGTNPTVAVCYNRNVQRLLALSYGVLPYLYENDPRNAKSDPGDAFRSLIRDRILDPNKKVVYISGTYEGVTALEIGTPASLAKP